MYKPLIHQTINGGPLEDRGVNMSVLYFRTDYTAKKRRV